MYGLGFIFLARGNNAKTEGEGGLELGGEQGVRDMGTVGINIWGHGNSAAFAYFFLCINNKNCGLKYGFGMRGVRVRT